jgi:hypothetical protein
MSNADDILLLANDYYQSCLQSLVKLAYIRKLPNGKYRVFSEKGRNLGTYKSRDAAKERLRQVEYFKHVDDSKADDSEVIDLTDIDDFSYSACLRKIRQKCSKDQVRKFLEIYKIQFDKAVKEKLQKPERVALQNSVVKFGKLYKIKINKKLIKNAAVSELGDPALVGKYLADIIRFTLTRISPEKRPHALDSLKNKIYNMNENEISIKDLPPSSAMGQSITFVKHVLFNHNARYIREVLNNIVRNL